MRPHYFPGGGMFCFWPFGVLALLVIGAIVLAIWTLKRRHNPTVGMTPPMWRPGPARHHGAPPAGPQPGPSGARQILDDRLARGDLDVDDYLARRAALLGDNGQEFTPPADPGVHPEGHTPTN